MLGGAGERGRIQEAVGHWRLELVGKEQVGLGREGLHTSSLG